MATDKGNIEQISPEMLNLKAGNGLDPDEVYTFIAALIHQNAELIQKLESLESKMKTSEQILSMPSNRVKSNASDSEEEARRRAAAIIAEAESRALMEAERIKTEAARRSEEDRQQKIDAAIQEGQLITQKAIETAETIKARAEEEAGNIILEAKKKTAGEESRISPKIPAVTAKEGSPASSKETRTALKGALVYSWDIEMYQQQHCIEIVLTTIMGLFATGSGRLVVDGEPLDKWGWNPFNIIPNSKLEFEIAGRRACIRSKGTATNYPVLVMDNQEIPPAMHKT